MADTQRSKPFDLASLNPQLLGAPKQSDGSSPLNSPSGFVLDYELVQSCTNYTFQSGHTYVISNYVQIGYVTIESGAVIKFASGDLEPICDLTCPDSSGLRAVLTDVNDDSVGLPISGSVGHFTGYPTFTPVNLSGLENEDYGYYWVYVHHLDIRFMGYGIVAPMNEGYGCYIYDNWFFKCSYGIGGSPDFVVGPSSCDFCDVDTPFSYEFYDLYDITYCSVDRNGNGLPDDWEFKYFDSLTHSGSELDANGNTLLYDYQHYANFPSVTISAPANNSSTTTTRVNVTGTFVEPFLGQISVNGVKAFTSGNTYEALNVPVQPGVNTITATVQESSVAAIFTGVAQRTATASVTVNGSTTPVDPVQLTATPVVGFAPLSVSFQVNSSAPGTFQQVLYDFDGNGTIDQTANNLNVISHSYSSPGGWNSADPSRLTINVQPPPVVNPQDTITVTDPVDLKTTTSGNLYVLSGSTATIFEYNATGNLLRSLAGIGTSPSGLDVDAAGNVYVAVTGDNQVLKFNPTAASFQLDATFGTSGHIGKTDKSSGSNSGEFNAPFDVAINPNGTEIAVSDSGNNRIQKFNCNGEYLVYFGQQGNGIGQFSNPKGISYDGNYLYIVDSGNNRIAVALYSVTLGTSGSFGTSSGNFEAPANLGIGSRGIYVADAGNNRVQEFEQPPKDDEVMRSHLFVRGTLSTELSLSFPKSVAAVEQLSEEDIYIADTGHNRVLLAKLPFESPENVWTAMKQHLVGGDIEGALSYFSPSSVTEYRRQFVSVGSSAIIPLFSQIPTISPVSLTADSAEYHFETVIQGVTLTFSINFVKINGIWKIESF